MVPAGLCDTSADRHRPSTYLHKPLHYSTFIYDQYDMQLSRWDIRQKYITGNHQVIKFDYSPCPMPYLSSLKQYHSCYKKVDLRNVT